MSQESIPIVPTQHKRTLGEQVRRIADQLKQETDIQIKATSHILGAAAQITENHDQLIREVVDMVEEDLDDQPYVYSTKTYTVDTLKQRFRTLGEAKSHFELKASSWAALVKKLNDPSVQNLVLTDPFRTSVTKRLSVIESEIGIMHTKVNQILFLLKQLPLDEE